MFWKSLIEVDDAIVKVIQSADELDALASLVSYSAAEEALDRMIAVVRARLSALPEKSWYAFWSDGTEA